MPTIAKQRIKRVFDNTLKNVSAGKPALVSIEMRKQGYSPSSCKALKVKATKTWQQLLNRINDEWLLIRLNEIALNKEDKNASIKAIKEIMLLKDKYPTGKLKIGAFTERDKIVEESK